MAGAELSSGTPEISGAYTFQSSSKDGVQPPITHVVSSSVGQVEVITDGLSVHTRSNGEDVETPIPKMTAVPFPRSITVVSEQGTLNVTSNRGRNGLIVDQKHAGIVTQPDSPLALPPRPERTKYEMKVGHIPGEATVVAFGQPDESIRVRYLGHPWREVLDPLIDGQEWKGHHDAQEMLTTDRKKASLLFTGKSVQANVHSFSKGDGAYDGNTPQDELYPGKLMIGACYSDGPTEESTFVEVFAAVRSDADGLLRLKTYPELVNITNSGRDGDPTVCATIDELAAVSVFSRVIDDPAFDGLVDVANFPLTFIEATKMDMRYRAQSGFPGNWYTKLREQQGMDWVTIRNELPKSDIQEEIVRISDVLGVEYQKPPKYSVQPPKRRRGTARNLYGGSNL